LPEIRTIQTPDEIAQVARLTAHTLQPDRCEQVEQLLNYGLAQGTVLKPERCVVCLDEGRVVASVQALRFEVSVGASTVVTAGLAGIVVEPTYWGRECVQEMFEFAGQLAEASDYQLVLGFGIPHFYERWGGVVVLAACVGRLEARRARDRPSSPFREATPNDEALLLQLYTDSNRGRTGTLRRTPEVWRYCFMKPAHYRIREDAYFGYDVEETEKVLALREVGARSFRGYRDALLGACAEAREQGLRWVRTEVPFDDPLLSAAAPYGVKVELEYPRSGHWIGRMLDLGDFFRRIEGELKRRLEAAGHPGVRLSLVAGQESLTLDLGPGPKVDLNLDLSKGSLLQLAFGYREPVHLLAEQGVELSPPEERALQALFPRTYAHMWYGNRF
jgi:predicted N-acetyltransferase YhbS